MGAAPTAVRGNLPAELSSFVGRRGLLQEIKARLSAGRIVTLVGPGGVGKTRLALRAAAEMQRAVTDGAWVAELAGLNEPELVPKAVMTALGLRDQSGSWTTSLLVDHLRDRRLLLVLDNCEHLLDVCAVLTEVVLREAAAVRVVATSRQPLGVQGESVLTVAPLGLPAAGHEASADELVQSEAVSLFVERATQATGTFVVTDDNRSALVELVRHLDGMPLAIELAAGRLRTLGLSQILERLGDRFGLLERGPRTAHPRQQSLRAAIDWSHDLLDAPERAVLRRLSLFAGSIGLDAVETVCAADPVPQGQVVDLLAGLVDRSFVNRLGSTSIARYRLHETMRDYALDKLREADEERATTVAYINFYADAARRFAAEWNTLRLLDWLPWVEQELDNVRAALERCLADPEEQSRGLRIVGSLAWFWVSRAVAEGVHWLDRVLQLPGGPDDVRAQALFARGLLAVYQADGDTAVRAAVEGEELARRAGDAALLAWVLNVRSNGERIAGDLAAARRNADAAVAVARELGEPLAVAAAALPAGNVAVSDGDADGALDMYLEAAHLCRDQGSPYLLSMALQGAGFACLALGRAPDAELHLKEALSLARSIDDRAGLAFRVQAMVGVAAEAGDPQRTARLVGVAHALQQEIGGQPLPLCRIWLGRGEDMAREALGDARFESLRDEGRRLDREAAVGFVLGRKPQPEPPQDGAAKLGPLSRREREIALLVAEGLGDKEIARRLFLSERTVQTHVYNILNKLGFNSRVQVAAWVAAGTPASSPRSRRQT